MSALASKFVPGLAIGLAVAAVIMTTRGCGPSAAVMNQSTANVKHITEAEFPAEVTQSKLPVIADFYATWCGPCRALSPIIDSLADQYNGRLKFVKVNVDESPKLAQQFQITGIPALLFFRDGHLAGTSTGYSEKDSLIRQFDSLVHTN